MATRHLPHADMQRPTLGGVRRLSFRAYSPYGVEAFPTVPLTGFAGERRDHPVGGYHLGNGHRMFDPVLMRFHTPDRMSPFGKGGVNAYAYCLNDPINFHDPSGRFPSWLSPVRSIIGGFLNLAVSAVKAYRGYRVQRDFVVNSGYPGTRSGIVPSNAAESPISRWTIRDTVLTSIGSVSAGVSIGTAIGRLSAADSDALMWVDTTFTMVATALSGWELYTIATTPRERRYTVQLQSMDVRDTSV